MKPSNCGRWCLLGLTLMVTPLVYAEGEQNPYQTIVERNAFGLKPPPTPPDPASLAPPPAPLAKVVLTGITSMFGPSSKRALFEIEEQEPGKAKNAKKPILREGEREGSVEVLSIDVEKSVVRIRNGTVETNLTFEIPKAGPAAPPALPGGAPMPMHAGIPGFNPAAMTPAGLPTPAVATGPTIISRNNRGSSPGGYGGGYGPGATPSGGVSTGFTPTPSSGAVPSATLRSPPYGGGYRGGGMMSPPLPPMIPK